MSSEGRGGITNKVGLRNPSYRVFPEIYGRSLRVAIRTRVFVGLFRATIRKREGESSPTMFRRLDREWKIKVSAWERKKESGRDAIIAVSKVIGDGLCILILVCVYFCVLWLVVYEIVNMGCGFSQVSSLAGTIYIEWLNWEIMCHSEEKCLWAGIWLVI